MLSKNLHLCFTKIVPPSSPDSSPIRGTVEDDHNRNCTTGSTSSSAATDGSTLIKNFNSLYDLTPESSTSKSRTSDGFSTSDSETESGTPDLATVFASQRFFFSSPGRSNSIVESSSSLSSLGSPCPCPCPCPPEALIDGGVPCSTDSPDPYMDFRRSMQEMVDAKKLSDVTSDWDFLHELLLCYLALNPKHAHKYIIAAFADLLISLMASHDGSSSGRREPDMSESR